MGGRYLLPFHRALGGPRHYQGLLWIIGW